MNRRNFLSLAALAIAGKAAERVFPFRVYSIPKEIVVAPCPITLHLAGERFYASLVSEADRLYGMHYYQDVPPSIGPWMGLSRSSYPKAILPPVDWYSTYGKNDIAQLRFNVPDSPDASLHPKLIAST